MITKNPEDEQEWDSNRWNQRFQLTNTTKKAGGGIRTIGIKDSNLRIPPKKLGVGFEPTGNRSAGGHISHSVTPARGLKIKRGAL